MSLLVGLVRLWLSSGVVAAARWLLSGAAERRLLAELGGC